MTGFGTPVDVQPITTSSLSGTSNSPDSGIGATIGATENLKKSLCISS